MWWAQYGRRYAAGRGGRRSARPNQIKHNHLFGLPPFAYSRYHAVVKRFLATCAMFGLLLAVPSTASPEEPVDLESLLTTGARLAQKYLPDELPADLQLPSPPEWQNFWARLPQLLETGSLEDLAEWMPYVETAAQLLTYVPGSEDYLAWLNQRLDYFEVASAVVSAIPEPTPPTPVAPARPPLLKGRVTILPTQRSSPLPAASPAVARQRRTTASSVRLWKTKMARRPPPVTGIALVPSLKKVFKEEGVPIQLVWLAEVESSMNPRARNPGGASGLFQFMPATAKRFGLRTRLPDERTHPEKSARAAARYLKFLYSRFNDWPLSLAAYNAGEGRVQGLLDRHKAASFDEIAQHLPTETRLYVPKVQAVVSLREGIEDLKLPPPTLALVNRLRLKFLLS
jgi:membrane-bound lytic murein transglycosylase D